MNKAGVPEKPEKSSATAGDDIPLALRDTPDAAPKERSLSFLLLIGGVGGFVILAIITTFWFFSTASKKDPNSQPIPVNSALPQSNNSINNNNDTVLGHLSYPEAPASELIVVSKDGSIRMRKAAGEKFLEMVTSARNTGVILIPISGFRSVKDQEQLFFNVGAQRNQTPAERAALSAPPGHSEHHTGYAVDIGDGKVPSTNLQVTFEKTKAYEWLKTNAARFSFEISFPENNVQGVSYEPWHWRFVGDRQSLEMFYKARNLKPVIK